MMKKKPEDLLAGHVSGQSNRPMSRPAHGLTYEQVATETEANLVDGLSPTEAQSRLETFGKNELGEAAGVQPLKILIGQIANAMTLV
jgi:P-type Na+/K+ transporter